MNPKISNNDLIISFICFVLGVISCPIFDLVVDDLKSLIYDMTDDIENDLNNTQIQVRRYIYNWIANIYMHGYAEAIKPALLDQFHAACLVFTYNACQLLFL